MEYYLPKKGITFSYLLQMMNLLKIVRYARYKRTNIFFHSREKPRKGKFTEIASRLPGTYMGAGGWQSNEYGVSV